MQRQSVRRFRMLLLMAVAAMCVAQATMAKAELYIIDSSQSTLQLTISVGVYGEGEDSTIFDPVLGSMVGQANALPLGNISGGVVPFFGDGSIARLSGALNVNSAGLTFSSASGVTLLDSGLWQPNSLGDASGLPTSAQAGGYLLTSLIDPDDTEVFASLSNTTFAVQTSGPLSVGVGGAFHDPLGTATLLTNSLAGYIASPLFNGPITYAQPNPFSRFTNFNGTLLGNELTFSFSTFLDNNQEDTLGVPLIVREIIDVHIVARAVPEPSSLLLAGCGSLFCLAAVARQRRKRRL